MGGYWIFLDKSSLKVSLMLSSVKNPISPWRGLSPARRSEALAFYLWVTPWIIGFLIWQLWPLIESLYLGFTNYRLLNTPTFTGMANVERLLSDNRFWESLRVTAGYVIGVIPIGNAIALGAAMALAQKLRGVNIWRTIYFLPSVVSGVAAAVMWWYVFNPDAGLINSVLAGLGVKGPGWLTDPRWALISVIMIGWWSNIGTQVVVYLAGLKGIPASLYEAASIDGASGVARFRYITLPMLSPTIFFLLITGMISAFQVFDAAYAITDGGPNNATRFYIFNVYEEAFVHQNMGYASLLAWVLFVIILILTALVFLFSRNRVYYESQA
jgi:multiple sugar transport system permease protein